MKSLDPSTQWHWHLRLFFVMFNRMLANSCLKGQEGLGIIKRKHCYKIPKTECVIALFFIHSLQNSYTYKVLWPSSSHCHPQYCHDEKKKKKEPEGSSKKP